jgi:hypothetical protein
MSNFKKRAEELRSEILHTIQLKIKADGVDSQWYNERCVKIKGWELSVNVGGYEMREILYERIVDSRGMLYDYGCLSIDDLIEVAEFINL